MRSDGVLAGCGPIVAARTIAHPVGVFHAVTSVFVPGS